jgi:predicted nucleotidyltransferase
MEGWDSDILKFLELCATYEVRMLMVGGGAVNFHGYQRHSADVDFWIDLSEKNVNQLLKVFNDLGYEIDDLPESVKNAEQNISLKFSPESLNIELITRFSVNKSFEDAYSDAETAQVDGHQLLRWRVLNFEDLITSKIKAGRPKDILDIQELKRVKGL